MRLVWFVWLTTVLISGASSGIGAATAQLFSSCGSNVVLLARRKEKLAEVAQKCSELQSKGGFTNCKVVTIEADMQDRRSLDRVPERTEGLDIDM